MLRFVILFTCLLGALADVASQESRRLAPRGASTAVTLSTATAGEATDAAALAPITAALGLPAGTAWEIAGATHVDPWGGRHTRLRQTYRGVPVVAGAYVLHERPGAPATATGAALAMAPVGVTPTLDPAAASRAAALQYARASGRPAGGASAKPATPRDTRASRRPAPGQLTPEQLTPGQVTPGEIATGDADLVLVDAAYPRRSGRVALAYAVTLEIPARHDRRVAYVDAHTGRLLATRSLVAHVGVPGTGETTYYGTQAFPLDSVGPQRLLLRDRERGAAAVYLDRVSPERLIAGASRDLGTTVLAEAVDVYHGTLAFYDMMDERFGWRGIDGADGALESVVFDGEEGRFVNAYWNGANAAFGSGACHYGPLTSIDVVGHEFMHGVTDYTSDLIYRGESGALNEGMSDIFGKALERLTHPEQFSWELGNRFVDSPYARGFRSMSDPHLFEMPKVYRGAYWEDGAGVHINSSVLNHWFYLLVEGGAGVNDLGDDYDVAAVGIEEALAHVFSLQRDYLVSDSGYPDAYAFSLEIAAAAYGEASPAYASIAQAWRAVGLTPERLTGGGGFDLRFLGLDFVFMEACQVGEPVEWHFLIVATSDSTLAEGSAFEIYVDVDSGTHVDTVVATLEREAQPGELFVMSGTSDIVLAEAGSYQVVTRLLLDDDVAENNEYTDYYRFRTGDEVDYYVSAYVADADGECTAVDPEVEYDVSNEGCGPIADLALVLNYVDEDGGVLGSSTVPVGYIEAGGFAFGTFVLDRALYAAAARLTVQKGPAPADDDQRLYLDVAFPPVIDAPTTIALSDEADLGTLIPAGFSANFLNLGIVDYAGEAWWGSTGERFGDSTPPCPRVEDLFVLYKTAVLAGCVDFSDDDGPLAVTLDALHLTSDASAEFADLVDQYGGVGLAYEGDDGERVRAFATGLPGDLAGEYTFALPEAYTGPIELLAYSHEGEGNFGFDGTFERDADYTLVRNVRIGRAVSAVPEAPVAGALALSPNPATSVTRLGLPVAAAATLRVYDALGRVVLEGEVAGGSAELGVGSWPEGVYTVEATVTRTRERYVGRLVR